MTGIRISCGHNYKFEVGCAVCRAFEDGVSAHKDGRPLSEGDFYSLTGLGYSDGSDRVRRGWKEGWMHQSATSAATRYDLDSIKRNGPTILGQS